MAWCAIVDSDLCFSVLFYTFPGLVNCGCLSAVLTHDPFPVTWVFLWGLILSCYCILQDSCVHKPYISLPFFVVCGSMGFIDPLMEVLECLVGFPLFFLIFCVTVTFPPVSLIKLEVGIDLSLLVAVLWLCGYFFTLMRIGGSYGSERHFLP